MAIHVRPATPEDRAAADLLYVSAARYYDAYAGRGHARRLVHRVYPHEGHTASYAISRVAVLDGEVAGVLAAFPSRESERLGRRFLYLSVPRIPVWRWPRVLRHLRAASRFTPAPPAGVLYVDALAVADGFRRRGIASRLLEAADAMAAELGLAGIALDTGVENEAAQSLYERMGFVPTGRRDAPDERTARAVGGRGFVSYVRLSVPPAAAPEGAERQPGARSASRPARGGGPPPGRAGRPER